MKTKAYILHSFWDGGNWKTNENELNALFTSGWEIKEVHQMRGVAYGFANGYAGNNNTTSWAKSDHHAEFAVLLILVNPMRDS